MAARFASLGVFAQTPHGKANHCLVNEYVPGWGIMPHEDGDAYAPVVATVSLGASVVLDVYQRPDCANGTAEPKLNDDDDDMQDGNGKAHTKRAQPTWRIIQEPRSLLVTSGPVYASTLHGIADVDVDEDLNAQTVANWDLLGDAGVFERARGRNVRGTRTSLTYRDVLRVSNAGTRILGGRR